MEIERRNLGREEGDDARPSGARQNLNPFKQLPHFAGVYNSWEAPWASREENCAAENISTLVNRRAREFP